MIRFARVSCCLLSISGALSFAAAHAADAVDPALAARRAAYSAIFKEQMGLEAQLKTLPEQIQCMALGKAWLDLEPELAKFPTQTPRQKFDLQSRVSVATFVIETYAKEIPNERCQDLRIAAGITWEEATYRDSYNASRVKVEAVKASADLYNMQPHHTFTDFVKALVSHLQKQGDHKAAHPTRTPPPA